VRRAAVVAAIVAVAVAAAAFSGTRPDPATQAQADGCGRDLAGLFKKEQPTWVYVNDAGAPATGPALPPQWARGVVSASPAWLGAHPADVDDPVSHDSFDFLVNVEADAPYGFLLGTGNFAADGEETGRLHTEWEEATYAQFAWPEPGDRVELLGSWVWDCGHWQGGGERTELHPLRAVWVQRHGVSPRSPVGETEGDLFISTDRTPAGASADCAHRAKGDRAAFKACLAAEPNYQDVNGTYRFNLVVPPRPTPAAKLRVRLVDAGSSRGAPAVKILPGAGGPSVFVSVSVPAGRRVVVAKQIFAGWDRAPRPVHLRVHFERILVRRAMDPGCPPTNLTCASVETTRKGQISRPPGEWVLYWDVAGVWGRWRPPLLRPTDGETIRADQTVDVYVSRSAPWRVVVTGRECDNGTLSAHSITSPPSPCPRRTFEFLDLAGDDSPGAVVDSYSSPAVAVGEHVSNSRLYGSSCPPVNRQGCYQVAYRVTAVR
jgi:hypothetical protein